MVFVHFVWIIEREASPSLREEEHLRGSGAEAQHAPDQHQQHLVLFEGRVEDPGAAVRSGATTTTT
jgi:hypothetical protein